MEKRNLKRCLQPDLKTPFLSFPSRSWFIAQEHQIKIDFTMKICYLGGIVNENVGTAARRT